MPRNGARVLPLEVVPVPVPGAQMFAWAPTKSFVQTRARAREPRTGTESERGLKIFVFGLRDGVFSYGPSLFKSGVVIVKFSSVL